MLFDSNRLFESQISSICKTDFFHLKNISKLRPMLSTANAEMLIHAFMTLCYNGSQLLWFPRVRSYI